MQGKRRGPGIRDCAVIIEQIQVFRKELCRQNNYLIEPNILLKKANTLKNTVVTKVSRIFINL